MRRVPTDFAEYHRRRGRTAGSAAGRAIAGGGTPRNPSVPGALLTPVTACGSSGRSEHDPGEDDDDDRRGGGDDAARPLQAKAHRVVIGAAGVVQLLHPGEQEDFIV